MGERSLLIDDDDDGDEGFVSSPSGGFGVDEALEWAGQHGREVWDATVGWPAVEAAVRVAFDRGGRVDPTAVVGFVALLAETAFAMVERSDAVVWDGSTLTVDDSARKALIVDRIPDAVFDASDDWLDERVWLPDWLVVIQRFTAREVQQRVDEGFEVPVSSGNFVVESAP